MRTAIIARTSAQRICLRIDTVEDEGGTDEGIPLVAQRDAQGRLVFPERQHRRLDALASVGLLRLEERTVRRGETDVPVRVYYLTALGEQHYRDSGSEDPRAYRPTPSFCYGHGSLINFWDIHTTDYDGCALSLSVSVFYVIEGIPDWAEQEVVRAAFPEWIGRAQARAVRYGRFSFLREGERWVPGEYDAAHSTCIGRRTERRIRRIWRGRRT